MDSSCDQYISISASNILSLIGVYKSTCKEYLITNCLKSKNSLYQYNVSVRLVAIVCHVPSIQALCYLTDYHDTITDEMVDIAFSHINTLPDWKVCNKLLVSDYECSVTYSNDYVQSTYSNLLVRVTMHIIHVQEIITLCVHNVQVMQLSIVAPETLCRRN